MQATPNAYPEQIVQRWRDDGSLTVYLVGKDMLGIILKDEKGEENYMDNFSPKFIEMLYNMLRGHFEDE